MTNDPKTKALELYEGPFTVDLDELSIKDRNGLEICQSYYLYEDEDEFGDCLLQHIAQALNDYWARYERWKENCGE